MSRIMCMQCECAMVCVLHCVMYSRDVVMLSHWWDAFSWCDAGNEKLMQRCVRIVKLRGFDEVGVNWLQWIKIQYANKPCLHMEWSGIPIWNQPNINVFVTAARILPTGTRCQQQVGIYKYQKRDEGLHCGGPPLLCLLQGPPTVHVTHKRRRKIGLALLPLPQYARHSINSIKKFIKCN